MRRIYESDALVRDDHPHTPSDRDEGSRSTIDWSAASHALMPVWLRDRAVSVTVETDREVYRPDEPVGVRVQLYNRLPFPVRLRTRSPVLWQWSVDDLPEASHVERSPPTRAGALSFARGERKTFTRTWDQSVRVSEREWEPIAPGEHTVAAWVNVDDANARGLYAETTVRIEDD